MFRLIFLIIKIKHKKKTFSITIDYRANPLTYK